MKTLFALLLLIVPFSNYPNEVPQLKKIIKVNDTELRYLYKGKRINRTVVYTLKNKTTFTRFLKNKKLEFELKSLRGKLFYRISKHKKFGPLTSKTWTKLNDELKHFIESHKIHQRAFDKPMKGGGNTNLDLGIAQTWSNYDAINTGTQASGDDDCTQSGSCSCGETTREVTCPCLRVIHCESKTVMRCDYDDAGNETNCREVTGCMAMCL